MCVCEHKVFYMISFQSHAKYKRLTLRWHQSNVDNPSHSVDMYIWGYIVDGLHIIISNTHAYIYKHADVIRYSSYKEAKGITFYIFIYRMFVTVCVFMCMCFVGSFFFILFYFTVAAAAAIATAAILFSIFFTHQTRTLYLR